MDKNKDGVVTLEEFVLACQEVGLSSLKYSKDQDAMIIHYLPNMIACSGAQTMFSTIWLTSSFIGLYHVM